MAEQYSALVQIYMYEHLSKSFLLFKLHTPYLVLLFIIVIHKQEELNVG